VGDSMGLFADILEANREREYSGYIDPCAIMWSFQGSQHSFKKYRDKLNQYEPERLSDSQVMQIKEEFQEKSLELERLKASYLIAEKSVLEIINRGKLQTSYMLDMLNALQHQMQNAYRAICKLRLEIDQKVGLKLEFSIETENEDSIRMGLLERLIKTSLLHMEKGIFQDTSMFRKVVSDCAELIRCLKNEEYLQSDKMILNYYLVENMGLKAGHHVCKNCGKLLLSNVPYCLNCYERN
jgi:hypothetical protein